MSPQEARYALNFGDEYRYEKQRIWEGEIMGEDVDRSKAC
jgi:hypothetical protein